MATYAPSEGDENGIGGPGIEEALFWRTDAVAPLESGVRDVHEPEARKEALRSFVQAEAQDTRERIRELQNDVFAFDTLPSKKEHVRAECQRALREQTHLSHRLIERITALGLEPSQLTRCVEDPTRIGWWNLLKETVRDLTDDEYRSLKSLAEEYAECSRRARVQGDTYEALFTDKRLQRTHSVPPPAERRFVQTTLQRTLQQLEKSLLEVERTWYERSNPTAYGMQLHQSVLDHADQLAQFGLAHPSASRTIEWLAIQTKLQDLEEWVNLARVHVRDEVEQLFRNEHVANENGLKNAAAIAWSKILDRMQEIERLHERPKDRADDRVIQSIYALAAEKQPTVLALLQAFQQISSVHEATKQLHHMLASQDQLRFEERELIRSYIDIMDVRTQRALSREAYHRSWVEYRAQARWIDEKGDSATDAERTELDKQHVAAIALAKEAYPFGPVMEGYPILEESLKYAMKEASDEQVREQHKT